jgi:SSS family solute:Na+ symporter
VVLVVFTLAALLFALNSEKTMYEMVQNAYKVTLVSCVVPLVFGLYWKRANNVGAMLSVVLGLASWLTAEAIAADALLPPQLVGLIASLLGMLLGSYIPREQAQHAAHGAHGATHAGQHAGGGSHGHKGGHKA